LLLTLPAVIVERLSGACVKWLGESSFCIVAVEAGSIDIVDFRPELTRCFH